MSALVRVLKLRSGDWDVDVPIRIFWPFQDNKSWYCRWEIGWPDRKRSNVAVGVDAIQAIRHALEMIGAELYSSDEHEAGALTFDGAWKGYGFPVPQNLRDRLIGDDKTYR
jgi:hypothetical protein